MVLQSIICLPSLSYLSLRPSLLSPHLLSLSSSLLSLISPSSLFLPAVCVWCVWWCVLLGLSEWEDDRILAAVLAASQQEYLDGLKHNSRGAESL